MAGGGLELSLEHLCSPVWSLSSLSSVLLAIISGSNCFGSKLICSFTILSRGGTGNPRTYSLLQLGELCLRHKVA